MIAGVLGVEEAGHVRTTERLGFFGRGAVVGRCCESQTRGPAVQLAVQTPRSYQNENCWAVTLSVAHSALWRYELPATTKRYHEIQEPPPAVQ
jgi:hypothetical protein